MSGLADGTCITVSGDPTPEEVAAITLALDAVAAADGAGPARRPAWIRAARLEQTGGTPARSPADLRGR